MLMIIALSGICHVHTLISSSPFWHVSRPHPHILIAFLVFITSTPSYPHCLFGMYHVHMLKILTVRLIATPCTPQASPTILCACPLCTWAAPLLWAPRPLQNSAPLASSLKRSASARGGLNSQLPLDSFTPPSMPPTRAWYMLRVDGHCCILHVPCKSHGPTANHMAPLYITWPHCTSHGPTVCHMAPLYITWPHCKSHVPTVYSKHMKTNDKSYLIISKSHGLTHQHTPQGLLPVRINRRTGKAFSSRVQLTVGAMADSYYEYLLKTWLVTDKKDPLYLDMWIRAMDEMLDKLLFTTPSGDMVYLGEIKHTMYDLHLCYAPYHYYYQQ